MSRSTRSHLRWPLVVTGFLLTGFVLNGLAASAATNRAQSTTHERALPDRIPAATHRVVAGGKQSSTSIDGNRASLNRSIATPRAPIAATSSRGAVRPVGGKQVLLPLDAFRPAGEAGRERGHSSELKNDLESAYFAEFTGVGAEGRDMVWRGAVAGAAVGELTVRLAQVGWDVDTAQPTWPVEGIIFVSGEDPRRAFAAEVGGTIDWRTKRVRLAGDVSLGYLRGAHLEVTADLVNHDLSGGMRVAPAQLAAAQ
jgi:hypothetical protein